MIRRAMSMCPVISGMVRMEPEWRQNVVKPIMIRKEARRVRWQACVVLMVCFSFAPPSVMAFQTISPGLYEVDGYKLDISVRQVDKDQLEIRGRISEGAVCNSLKLQMEFTGKTGGDTVRVNTTLTDVGIPNSQTIRVEQKLKKKKNAEIDTWELTDMKTKCLK